MSNQSNLALIGREPECGCLTTACMMTCDPETIAETIRDIRRLGMTMDVVDVSVVRVQFQVCTHKPKQASLLEGAEA